jgi:Tesmin/TSO1-like CXC domain, cysteine-rich domain
VGTCTCVGCHNIDNDEQGHRDDAMQQYLEKCPDIFLKGGKKSKEVGTGCACKNNRCIRKYCECFRNQLVCDPNKCVCRHCENSTMSTTFLNGIATTTAIVSKTHETQTLQGVSCPVEPSSPGICTESQKCIEAV